MTFLVLLLAVAAAHIYGPASSVQGDKWFYQWREWLAGRSWLDSMPVGRLIVALLGPVSAVALILTMAGGWLFGLVGVVINLAVLLYAFGRDDVTAMARTYRDDLEREDVQAAWHEASELDPRHSESPAESWPQLHDQALGLVSYRYFERFFPVIFWFVVLGVPGALLYRLASLALVSHAEDKTGADADKHLLWVLEWIPLRLLGLVFALVGNFAATMHHWREIFFCTASTTTENLGRLTQGALDAGSRPTLHQGALEIDAVAALYNRALVLSLGVIALLTILT